MNLKYSLLALTFCSFITSSCKEAEEAATKVEEKIHSTADLKVDNIGEKAAEILKGLPDILLSIEDEASLDAATAKLNDITKQTDALVAAASKLPKPPADQQDKLGDDMKKTIESQWGDKMGKAEQHMAEFAKNNPDLADKARELKNNFRASVGPIRNLFDKDGPLGGPAE